MAPGRPLLKGFALVAAVTLLLAACGGGGGKKTAASKSTTSTSQETTTTGAGGDTTTTAAGGGKATTKTTAKGSAGGSATNGQSANSNPAPAGTTPAKPAKSGNYTYDNQANGPNTFAPPPTSPLVIDPPQGTRQHSTVSSGSSGKMETTLDYLADGVHVVEIKLTAGSLVFDFVGNPPPLAAPTGGKPGQSVDFDLVDSAHGTTIHVHIDFVRTESISIGGQSVDTMVIHQVGTLSGQITGTQTQDAWVSQQDDLIVKTHQVADVKYQVYNSHSDVTSTLEKLTPS